MDIVIENLEIAFRVGVVDRRSRQRQSGGEERAAEQQADYRNRKNADHANHRESHSALRASHQLTGRPFVSPDERPLGIGFPCCAVYEEGFTLSIMVRADASQ